MTVFDTIPWDHPEWMTIKSNLYHRALGKSCIRSYDKVITISYNSARDIKRHSMHEDISVVYPGIDELFFKPFVSDDMDSLWHGLNYDLYVGGFDPRKNVDYLIKWWLNSKYQASDYLVLAGGNGWKNKETYKLIDQTDRVLCLRSADIETLYRLYHNCRDFYYPSLYEGYGLPLAEAMACGCRVHHLDNSSLSEVKPLHWKDQVKEVIKVYESILR